MYVVHPKVVSVMAKRSRTGVQRVLGVGAGVVLSFQSRSGGVMWKRQPGGMEHWKVVVNIIPGERGIGGLQRCSSPTGLLFLFPPRLLLEQRSAGNYR